MDDKLILLKNYETMVEAMFDQELLRENGIETSLNNTDIVELLPMFGDLDQGLCLLVFEKDFEKAIQLLEDYKNSVENL